MPLIEWIAEPQMWDKEKIDQDNLDYSKPLNKPLDETKDELKSLFWDFSKEKRDPLSDINEEQVPEEELESLLNPNEETIIDENHVNIDDFSDTPTEEDYMNNQKQVEIKTSKEFPLVKTFLSERNINEDTLSLNKDWKIDVNAIKWLEYEDKELLTGLLVNIEWDNRDQNRIDFSTNIKDIQEFSEYDLTFWDQWFDNGVLNRIWGNYIDIPDASWKIDVAKNISTSIQITKNEILKEAKNVKPDSQTYKTAIANIESWNLQKQLEWINSLYYLAFSSEGKLWAKESLSIHKNKRKKELINDANVLEDKIQIALNNNNQEELKKLDIQKDIIIFEVEELVKWDIFESGELDKMEESLEMEKQD